MTPTPTRSRNRQSAKAAGTRFEAQVAAYLSVRLSDDRIERRAKTGAKDRGDIAGVRYRGDRVTIECKNTTRLDIAAWVREAHLEAGNDDAAIGVIVHKRHGVGAPAEQWVTMTLTDFAYLLGAPAPTYDE